MKDLWASFPDAALIEVSSGSGTVGSDVRDEATRSGKAADPAAQKKLEDLKSSSPEEYQKKSRKLPDELSTGGKKLPKDKQAPRGAEQGGTTIR